MPYEGYPQWALIAGGWLMVIALPIVSYLLMKSPTRDVVEQEGVSLDE